MTQEGGTPMTALIIIASILAFFLLLLLAPVSVEVRYQRGEADVKAHYLFLSYDLLKKRPAKPKKEPPPKEPEPEAGEKPKKKKENPLPMIWKLLKASRWGLGLFRRHLVFSRVRIILRVGGEDAHQIALTYGKVSAAVTAALDVIGLAFVLRKPDVAIAPDFLAPGIDAEARLRVGIRPLFALMAGVSIFRQYLRLQTRNKKRLNKGGKQHERAKSAASSQ
jgi:hypothetical protein